MAAILYICLLLSTILTVCNGAKQCSFNGITYHLNQQFKPDPCRVCLCTSGSIVCSAISCPPLRCVDSVKKQGVCCPVCPNGINCKYGDRVIKNGELYKLANGDACECPMPTGVTFHNANLTIAVCSPDNK